MAINIVNDTKNVELSLDKIKFGNTYEIVKGNSSIFPVGCIIYCVRFGGGLYIINLASGESAAGGDYHALRAVEVNLEINVKRV